MLVVDGKNTKAAIALACLTLGTPMPLVVRNGVGLRENRVMFPDMSALRTLVLVPRTLFAEVIDRILVVNGATHTCNTRKRRHYP